MIGILKYWKKERRKSGRKKACVKETEGTRKKGKER